MKSSNALPESTAVSFSSVNVNSLAEEEEEGSEDGNGGIEKDDIEGGRIVKRAVAVIAIFEVLEKALQQRVKVRQSKDLHLSLLVWLTFFSILANQKSFYWYFLLSSL